MTLLLAVLRRPEMLKALLSQRKRPFEPEGEGEEDPYQDWVIPLNQIPEEICPWRDADVKAWRSLAKVPKMSPRAAQAVTRILLSTVVEPGQALDDPGEPALGKRTLDLRPYLCHPASEAKIISAIGAGASESAVELPDWHWTHRQEIAEFPDRFRYYFLWRLSLKSWQEVELMAAMFDSLGLADDVALARAIARLTAATQGDSVLWWCDAIAELPLGRRVRVVEFILGCGVQEHRPDYARREILKSGSWMEVALSFRSVEADLGYSKTGPEN